MTGRYRYRRTMFVSEINLDIEVVYRYRYVICKMVSELCKHKEGHVTYHNTYCGMLHDQSIAYHWSY